MLCYVNGSIEIPAPKLKEYRIQDNTLLVVFFIVHNICLLLPHGWLHVIFHRYDIHACEPSPG